MATEDRGPTVVDGGGVTVVVAAATVVIDDHGYRPSAVYGHGPDGRLFELPEEVWAGTAHVCDRRPSGPAAIRTSATCGARDSTGTLPTVEFPSADPAIEVWHVGPAGAVPVFADPADPSAAIGPLVPAEPK